MPKKTPSPGPTTKPAELRCICRAQQRGRIGWRVVISRAYPDTRHYAKHFPDDRHGGERQALLAAQAWRDGVERRHPTISKTGLATLLRRSNVSGTPGVLRITQRRPNRDGTVNIRHFWQARSPRSIIPLQTRTFSIAVYGEDDAYRRAVAARRDFEALLTDQQES